MIGDGVKGCGLASRQSHFQRRIIFRPSSREWQRCMYPPGIELEDNAWSLQITSSNKKFDLSTDVNTYAQSLPGPSDARAHANDPNALMGSACESVGGLKNRVGSYRLQNELRARETTVDCVSWNCAANTRSRSALH